MATMSASATAVRAQARACAAISRPSRRRGGLGFAARLTRAAAACRRAQVARPAARRATVAVRAQAAPVESRRAVLGAVLGGVHPPYPTRHWSESRRRLRSAARQLARF
jgi:hypothetical protein